MRLILIGFGTVGRGVAESLIAATTELSGRGFAPHIVAVLDPVVGSVRHAAGLDPAILLRLADDGEPLSAYPGAETIVDLAEALTTCDADTVVELTPTDLRTGEPGLGHVRAALAAGCHVVTTNKGPVALAYRELEEAAAKAGVQFRFEGTVMSGTPVLNLCAVGLAGAGVRAVRGVVNGTCNFILSEMERGSSYDDALSEAQRRGYAETDPSGDVEGRDAAAKALIMANCLLGADLTLDDVDTVGITGVTREQIGDAADRGKRWRLVARVERDGAACRAAVAPEEVDADDPLAALTGPANLLVFETEALGDVAISGPGAGRRATGHAVVADLVAIHRSGG